MRTGAKLGAYGAVLAIVLGGGAAVGAASGPIDVAGAGHDDNRAHTTDQAITAATDPANDDGAAAGDTRISDLPGGLAVAEGGYRLDLQTDGHALTTPSELRFRIVDAAGEPVTDDEEDHEGDLHLVVVGHDLDSYAHLRPEPDARGAWTVDLPALDTGSYRAFVEVQPAGEDEALTLGADLTVSGSPPATAGGDHDDQEEGH